MPGPELLIPVGIELAKKIPVGKVERGAKKKFGELYREVRGQTPQPTMAINKNTPQGGVSSQRVQTVNTKETIAYQNREIGKELLLLEKHLQQGCKITNSQGIPTPCDCCLRHPLTLEGLTAEAVGMTSNPIYPELNKWVRELSRITTPEASSSGRYDNQYPVLAKTARDFRKKIMGTDQVMALLSPEEQKAIAPEVTGKRIAQELGVKYDGVQEGAGMQFTDPKTGSTTYGNTLSEVKANVEKMRQKFSSK